MHSSHSGPVVPERCDVLAEPVFDLDTVFERFKTVMIHRYPARSEVIHEHWVSVPIYLPEVACLISLDTTSREIARELFEMAFRTGENKDVMILKLYNFDPDRRRAVSWGNYSLKKLEERMHRIYAAALFNDMVLTPSGFWGGSIMSPLRCFPLESHGGYFFRCTYSYNVFVTFVESDEFRVSRKRVLWIGKPVEIVPVRAKFIKLLPDGTVKAEDVFLSFKEESLQNWKPVKGYHICMAESFNGYASDHPDARGLCGKNVNVVRSLYPVVHSPHDVVPFLSPYFVDPEQMDFLIKFTVPSASVKRILGRFEKFGGKQDGAVVENYAHVLEELNGQLRITDEGSAISLTAVNPSFAAFLVKRSLSGSGRSSVHARKILEKQKLLDAVEDIGDREINVEFLMAAAGSRTFIDAKKRNTDLLVRFFQTITKRLRVSMS